MLVFLIITAVLIGLAYADYCLVDNTEHFGICFGRIAMAGEAAAAADEVESTSAVRESEADRGSGIDPEVGSRQGDGKRSPEAVRPYRPQGAPLPAWLLLDLERSLELRERTP